MGCRGGPISVGILFAIRYKTAVFEGIPKRCDFLRDSLGNPKQNNGFLGNPEAVQFPLDLFLLLGNPGAVKFP